MSASREMTGLPSPPSEPYMTQDSAAIDSPPAVHANSGMMIGRVVHVEESTILVDLDASHDGLVEVRERLDRGEHALLDIQPGDEVTLISVAGRHILMGRVRALRHPANQPLPDTLLLEAQRELTLRVGDGSITLRADGKVLIKGKDLVSHAQRLNRIKGGAVSIN